MGKRLYIGNLSYDSNEQSLRDHFKDFTVTEVKIVMDKDTGRPRGFAFVEFETDDEARRAVSELDGVELEGRTLKVNEALDRPKGGGRGGDRRDDRQRNGGGRDRQTPRRGRDD